uniref:Uncharacterized protein n=1 Tax=Hyaloperonospora arabidopsidis (strain Emoy2) TaxID=559515 RepID=M4B4Q2_HYAAE
MLINTAATLKRRRERGRDGTRDISGFIALSRRSLAFGWRRFGDGKALASVVTRRGENEFGGARDARDGVFS